MKKFLNLCLVTVLAITLGACSSSSKALVVGLDDSFPPMGFRNESGKLVGFDIDMAEAAAEKMKMTIEFQPIEWSSKELELRSGKVDLLWNGLTITEERGKSMLFTKPYLQNKQVIMVKEGSDVQTKADLAGKKVGLQKESSAVEAVNNDKETASTIEEVVEYENNILAFQDLDIGRVDAVVIDEIVAKYYIANNDSNFILLTEDFGDEEYGVGIQLEKTDLRDKLQKALDEMNEDGTSTAISIKWFGEDIVVK